MHSPSEFYTQAAEKFHKKSLAIQRQIRIVAVARFIVFLAGLIAFGAMLWSGLGLSFPIIVWQVSGAILVSIFIVLITHHARLFAKKEEYDALHHVNTEELNACMGKISHLSDGSEFLSQLPQAQNFARDLDVFGVASLYQSINRTVTRQGANRLAEILTTLLTTEADIYTRQAVIAELKERTSFRQAWQAKKVQIRRSLTDSEIQKLNAWLAAPPVLSHHLIVRAMLRVGPILFLIGSCVAVVYPQSHANVFISLIFIVQMMLSGIALPRLAREAAQVQHCIPILTMYVSLFALIERETRQSPFSTEIPLRVNRVAHEALRAIRSLSRLLQRFDDGTSMMGAVVLNGTVLWNMHCIVLMERWRERYASLFHEWLHILADMDAFVSLAGFAFNHPHFVTPRILEPSSGKKQNAPVLRAWGMKHPLIPHGEAVPSDICFDESTGNICIITGANMAGKSTFLRSLGVNTVMAMVGLPVHAQEFECTIHHVMTSMRVTDSLERHESYFYAELKRLKEIVQRVTDTRHVPTLVLLDEILRGTNSLDKQTGTIGLLRRLSQINSPIVIATHDTGVGSLQHEFPRHVRNYCFEGWVVDGVLKFDYALRPGIATNKNATLLMESMGILPSPNK